MKGSPLVTHDLAPEFDPAPATQVALDALAEEAKQRVARKIAVESKKMWREAQAAGLDDLARLMEESFYRAYQKAGGPKAMRAV